MQRNLVVIILYGSIFNSIKFKKYKIANILKLSVFGINFVFIYILLSVGVWWDVGNTKLLKHKKHENIKTFEFVDM
jgi:hypothetical protein